MRNVNGLPAWQKNDKKANTAIIAVSAIVFSAITFLANFKWPVQLPFNAHVFAAANAIINSTVAVLLIAGLISARKGKYVRHKNIMFAAMVLSVLFLVSYIAHHLLTDATRYGDLNHDGIISDEEKTKAGFMRLVYFALLSSHILLAAVIMPFILYTAYRALTTEYARHRKLAKITFPIWLYVAISGVIIYLMISPYYQW